MAKKIKILIADDVDIAGFDRFPDKKFQIVNMPGISADSILENQCDALVIRSTRKITKEFVDKFNGNIIATFTKGTDHIDKDACKRNGIKIMSADEGNSRSAAEHTIALMLSAVKNLLHSDKLVRNGWFEELGFKRTELYGKKIGVIGYGSIGKRVAKLCEAFRMKVFANDINPKVRKKNKKASFKGLNYILKNCDIVTVHIPLENNVNFLSKEKLLLLREDSIFINTSRGEVLDEDFLTELLKEKRIRFAGLDVYKNEPNINNVFFDLDNVILSNHIAGKTVESRRRIAEEVTEKLRRHYNKKK